MTLQFLNRSREYSMLFKITGTTLIAEQLVFLVAFYILGTAISWPASLDLPAETVFPMIHAKHSAVFTGYYFYLLSSILLIPISFLIKASLSEENDIVLNTTLNVAVGFGVVSAAMKIIGIIRWLFAMPMLAEVYLDSSSTAAMKETAVINFDLLNNFAGKLGEHIGVQLITALFIGTVSYALLRTQKLSSKFGWIGFFVALLALPYEDLFKADLGPFLTISGTCISLWIIALGIGFLRISKRSTPQ